MKKESNSGTDSMPGFTSAERSKNVDVGGGEQETITVYVWIKC